MKMIPNPRRAELRDELAEVRRKGHKVRIAYRLHKKPEDLESRCYYRRLERLLSADLAETAPFVDINGDELWIGAAAHFARFRHSSRFARFQKIWRDKRRVWQRRKPIASTGPT